MQNNLIGKTVTFKTFFKMTDKLEDAELKLKSNCIKKDRKYIRSFFLASGKIEGVSTAGEGMSMSPCLIVSNMKFINKDDKKKLFDKSNASIPLLYVFFDQVESIK